MSSAEDSWDADEDEYLSSTGKGKRYSLFDHPTLPKKRHAVVAPMMCAVLVALYVVYSWPEVWKGNLKLAHWEGLNTFDTEALHITTESETYGAYSTAYPWAALAEPGRGTKIRAEGGWASATSLTTYTWTVDGVSVVSTSRTFTHVFSSLGAHTVEVSALGQGATETASTTVMCKYVRRELRSLTVADREAFLDAAKVLWTVNDEDGRRMYGSAFRSVHYFVRAHLYYSANYDCDHWHEGPGFVTSHVAMSLAFEKALQAVDSTVSLPYWDYTIDEAEADGDPKKWRNASLGAFSDEVFGEASPDASVDHVVTKGRWANVQVKRNVRASNYSRIANAGDELRAPWVNPAGSRALGGFRRFATDETSDDTELAPPSCKHHWWALNQKSWSALASNLNGASHGSMHKLIGGAWKTRLSHEASTAPLYAHADEAWAKAMAAYNFFFLKLVYRAGLADCSRPGAPCGCDARVLAENSAYDILDRVGILDAIVDYQMSTPSIGSYVEKKFADGASRRFDFPFWNATSTNLVLDALLRRACDWGEAGDMNAASSPFDITFWPIHPTIDRLWHAVRLGRHLDSSLAFDHAWPDGASPCYGHNASHVQPFENGHLFTLEKNVRCSGVRGFCTNADLYAALAPDADALPYVYDNFDWPHCAAQRYCMNLTTADYTGAPWRDSDCRAWSSDYDDVGRGYVVESDLTVPQLHPPALWDAHGNFLTDPRPRPANARLNAHHRSADFS